MHRVPNLSVIILNHNGALHLEECLRWLNEQTIRPEEVILVDLGSIDGSVELAGSLFPGITIQSYATELGYARAANLALDAISSETAVLLEPEHIAKTDWASRSRATRSWMERILATFDKDQAIGLVWPGLGDRSGQEESFRYVILDPLGLPGREEMASGSGVEQRLVFGRPIAIRRQAWAAAGKFDEGYRRYYENADLSVRMQKAGLRVMVEPGTALTAVLSDGLVPWAADDIFHSDRWRFLLKYSPAEEIIEETMLREMARLTGIEGKERTALRRAYRHTARALPLIMAARVAHGGTAMRGEEQAAIAANLLDLRQQAMQTSRNRGSWEELTQSGQVAAKPFSSNVPVFGALIAGLRSLWAAIAAKPYADSLNKQQNEFNLAFVRELEAVEARLQELDGLWMQQGGAEPQVGWAIQELQANLDESFRLLESIEERLAKMQENQLSD